MRRLIFLPAVIAAIWCAPADATPAPADHPVPADWPAALELARHEKADIAVLFHGSNWCPPGRAYLARWESPEFRARALAAQVVLVEIDRVENPGEAAVALAKRNEACGVVPRSYPALAYFDSEGRMIGMLEGLPGLGPVGQLDRAVGQLRDRRIARDTAWKRAEGLDGPARAEWLGRGLDAMEIGLGPKKVYGPVFDQMKTLDPEDRSGYLGKYTFPGQGLMEMALNKAGAGQHAEAERELDKWLANRRLSRVQQAELHAARYALYTRWTGREDRAASALGSLRQVDPESHLGKGAEYKIRQLRKNPES